MNDLEPTRVLARGIPQGYTPQRQKIAQSGMVLMSEWARKAAHELNDKHHNWIEARVKDEFADENLSEAQLRDQLDHTALLMNWEQISEYVPKVQLDHQMIYAYITYLNSNKGYVGRRKVSIQQWAAHKLSQQEEGAYKGYLLRVLKRRLKEFNVLANNIRFEPIQNIENDFDVAFVLWGIVKSILQRTTSTVLLDGQQEMLDKCRSYLQARKYTELRAGNIIPTDMGLQSDK